MIFIFIAILIAVIILLYIIGGKVRDNFVIDKTTNEKLIDVNDAVIFLGKNKNKEYLHGILFLTNRRLLFYKHKFNWLNIIPFIGEAVSSIFVDKKIIVEIPIHQIKIYHYKPKITYRENGPTTQEGFTTIFTKEMEEYDFDIFVLGMADGELPEILKKLEVAQKSLDNPNLSDPNK